MILNGNDNGDKVDDTETKMNHTNKCQHYQEL